jgi:5'-3' exonuclease
MRFGIVDLSNLFYRSRHGAATETELKIGLAQHILFRSLRRLHRTLKLDHVVFAVDCGSWRSTMYPAYKSRRKLERGSATVAQQEENRLFFAALDELTRYLTEHTRCTVLEQREIEGDDFIARWIARHPHDEHVIISGDSDFVQLIAPNVCIFDAVNQRMISSEAILDEQGRNLSFSVSPKDGKIRVAQPDSAFIPEADWWRKALFIKLIRGDSSDSIFSAYPGVRYEGKKCSIRAAWDDKEQGYDWNNLMCQTWHKLVEVRDGERITQEVRVLDEFRINESLIDLTKQPTWVIEQMDAAIDRATRRALPTNIGIHFLRFCRKHNLPDLAKEADEHVKYLNAAYIVGDSLGDISD